MGIWVYGYGGIYGYGGYTTIYSVDARRASTHTNIWLWGEGWETFPSGGVGPGAWGLGLGGSLPYYNHRPPLGGRSVRDARRAFRLYSKCSGVSAAARA